MHGKRMRSKCICMHVNDAKEEEEERCSDIQQGGEDVDVESEESTHRSWEEDTLDWMEAAERREAAGKNEEEIMDNNALTGVKTDESGKHQSWNPAACHVPGRMWLEQFHARIRGSDTFWLQKA
ncbi:hypothetical protein NDU88_001939 [Pleurodeles waltl]|uniref:Uncharacterized protein n=1 Tax=Pleurodeles waltl TaxID=8319 RepID=A0AAV7WQ58_PLEWA|nr:hypothetical protein NDU88_001939 [Pleurodeles waltl]